MLEVETLPQYIYCRLTVFCLFQHITGVHMIDIISAVLIKLHCTVEKHHYHCHLCHHLLSSQHVVSILILMTPSDPS